MKATPKHALLISEDFKFKIVTQYHLEHYFGIGTITCLTYAEALDEINKFNYFDLILVDAKPLEDGWIELTAFAHYYHIAVIVLTCGKVCCRLCDAAADAFIQKSLFETPANIQVFESTINAVCEAHSHLRTLDSQLLPKTTQ